MAWHAAGSCGVRFQGSGGSDGCPSDCSLPAWDCSLPAWAPPWPPGALAWGLGTLTGPGLQHMPAPGCELPPLRLQAGGPQSTPKQVLSCMETQLSLQQVSRGRRYPEKFRLMLRFGRLSAPGAGRARPTPAPIHPAASCLPPRACARAGLGCVPARSPDSARQYSLRPQYAPQQPSSCGPQTHPATPLPR